MTRKEILKRISRLESKAYTLRQDLMKLYSEIITDGGNQDDRIN